MAVRRLGLVKVTLLDFPGEVACTVFTSGCNLRCPYCHNPEMVLGESVGDEIELSEFFQYLEKRRNLLGGVCITGGEPLIHEDLPELIEAIREKGLKVKVDTNGTFPERLETLRADYIAMDLKTVPDKYHLLVPNAPLNLPRRIRESVEILKASPIPHHFRTTAVPGIVDREDFREILQLIQGESQFYLSGFRPGKTLDPAWGEKMPYSEEELEAWQADAIEAGLDCVLRMNREKGSSAQTAPKTAGVS